LETAQSRVVTVDEAKVRPKREIPCKSQPERKGVFSVVQVQQRDDFAEFRGAQEDSLSWRSGRRRSEKRVFFFLFEKEENFYDGFHRC
jgi:hypothetical protein